MENYLFILGILFSIIGFLAVWILNELKDSVTETKTSVQELNTNVAIIIKTVEYHDDRIKKLEQINK